MTALRRHRARRGEGARLRGEILAAAEQLLVMEGDADAVSIRSIAAAAGVTPPSIYLHFSDKDALFFEVAAEHFRRIDRAIREALDGVEDPLDALRAVGRAYVRFGLEWPAQYRVILMTPSSQVPQGLTVESLPGMQPFEEVVDVVRRGVETGRLRPVDPFVATTGLWVALHGLVSLLVHAGEELLFPWPDRDALVEHVIDAQVRGLAAE